MFFKEKGDVDKLIFGNFPRPSCSRGEVLVRVLATSVNHLDITTRDGTARVEFPLPHIPGCDAAGIVEEVGEDVSMFSRGEKVVLNPGISCGKCSMCRRGMESVCTDFTIVGEHRNGAYAEYIAVPERNLMRLPPSYPFIKAAAAPLVYLTAWHALVSRAHISFGERILVSGGSGGVSTAAIQIAKLFDAHVATTTRSEEKVQKLAQIGVDEVLISKENWSKDYLAKGNDGFDLIIDSTGSSQWREHLRLLRKGGRIVNYGITSGGHVELELAHIFWKQQSIIGSTMGDYADFETVMKLVFSGKLEPVVDRVFALRDAAAAQSYVSSARQVGKVVIVNGESEVSV